MAQAALMGRDLGVGGRVKSEQEFEAVPLLQAQEAMDGSRARTGVVGTGRCRW